MQGTLFDGTDHGFPISNFSQSEAPKQIRHSQSLELVFCQKCFVDTTKNSSGFLHVLLNPLEPSCGEAEAIYGPAPNPPICGANLRPSRPSLPRCFTVGTGLFSFGELWS